MMKIATHIFKQVVINKILSDFILIELFIHVTKIFAQIFKNFLKQAVIYWFTVLSIEEEFPRTMRSC